MTPDGVLVIDKPAGITSHDVVARVRQILGIARVGHTGTLDPAATGVLPLVLGRATRLARFLAGREKAYVATIRLGLATDSHDATGQPIGQPAGPVPSREAVEAAIAGFRGRQWQTPPAFSAKKVGGVRAYVGARKAQAVTLAPVEVTVERLDVEAVDDDLVRLSLVCSAGFYVRSLAHDLGQVLGCGAHLAALRRTRSGAFELAAALPLDRLEGAPELAETWTIPMDRLLTDLRAVVVTPAGAERARHGNEIRPSELERPGIAATSEDSTVRVLDEGGRLLGLARPGAGGVLRPFLVLV
jgi:tRNA pseudouridine55 synthase